MSEPLVLNFPGDHYLSDAECLETINIPFQTAAVRKNHAAKYVDTYKACRETVIFGIIIAVFSIMSIAFGIITEKNVTTNVGIFTLVLAAFIVFIDLYGIIWPSKKKIKLLQSTHIDHVLTLDEKSVEIKGDDGTFSLPWKQICCVRAYEYHIAFFPNETAGIIIVCDISKADEIRRFVEENDLGAEFFENIK